MKNFSLQILLTILITYFPYEMNYAQWEWLNPLPQGNKLNKVSFTDINNGTAVGSTGTIIRTTDGGSTWTIQQSGLTTNLFDVCFVDANIGTVVGGVGKILHTTDGGQTWITQTSGLTTTLRGVSFTDVNNGTAVGAQGKILRTTNGGATWTQQTSGTTSFLYSVSFIDSTTGTAVGAAGTIRRTTNGGATWTAQTSGITGILWSVSFVDSDHGTAVGDNQKIIHTTDGGATWTPQISQAGGIGPLYGVSFADVNNGWNVGSQLGETIEHTTDGGNTWTSQFFQIYPSLNGISAIDRNTAVAVGSVGAILSTTNEGATWINQVHGTQNVLGPVVFTSTNVGYVGGTYGLIQKTTDAGLTWINQTSGVTNSMFYGMYFVNENVGTAVSAGGDIVRTTNGGNTWIVQSSGNSFLLGVAFTDVNHGFVSGGASFLSTTDGGTTWIPLSGGLSSYAGISFGDSLNGTVVGSGIIHTTDGGSTWAPQSSGTSNYLWFVHFIDANIGTAVGDAGTIIHTTNGGTTWTTQTSGTTNDLWGVHFVNANTGTAVGDLGVIVQTTDGGLNWVVEQSPTANFLNGVTYPTPYTCIVTGEGGAILAKRTLTAPAPPTNLFAIADTFRVNISWTDNSDNELGFKIERKGDSLSVPGTWTLIDSVGANETTFTNTGLTPNTVYSYKVYGYNEAGNSPYSNIAQAQTIIPVEFTSFTANQNGTDINISWITATEKNNKGFELERKNGEESAWEKISFIEGKGTTTEKQEYLYSDNFKYKSDKEVIYYRLKQIDYDGTYNYSNIIEVDVDFTPKEYTLYQNYPNPFNPTTTIKYALPYASNIKIVIYNMLGETIGELINGVQETGYYDVTWNAGNVSSGIYFYTIVAKAVDGKNNYTSVKKALLMK